MIYNMLGRNISSLRRQELFPIEGRPEDVPSSPDAIIYTSAPIQMSPWSGAFFGHAGVDISEPDLRTILEETVKKLVSPSLETNPVVMGHHACA